jgi:2-methylfumaryl-CoA hydratase
VRRREDAAASSDDGTVPELAKTVAPDRLGAACPQMEGARWDPALAGSLHRFSDYAIGEKIDHVDGVTVEDAEPMLAARLYQNNARVHFNAFGEGKGRLGRRLIYGGHVISTARALSFNGLGNCFHIAAINGGRHAAPLFAGATVFAWSVIMAKADIPGRNDLGALRILTRATRDQPADEFPTKSATADDPGVILEFDYWALIPR